MDCISHSSIYWGILGHTNYCENTQYHLWDYQHDDYNELGFSAYQGEERNKETTKNEGGIKAMSCPCKAKKKAPQPQKTEEPKDKENK